MEHPRERLVLHPSVPVRWWLTHLPNAQDAGHFLNRKLVPASVGVIAQEDIRLRVLDEVARDLGQFQLAASIAALLFRDITELFTQLTKRHILHLRRPEDVDEVAFTTASFYNIPFHDAVAAALAERSNLPLLVADQETRQKLGALEMDRSRFQVVWVPDYQDS